MVETASVTFTNEERVFLREILENALKEARIEEHRTRAPRFREHVLHREELINNVLAKIDIA